MRRAAPVLASQGGLISRDQARSLGLSDRQIDHALRTGSWVALHPQVYALNGVPETRARSLRAASMWVEDRGALSHHTAAEVCGVGPTVSRLHATVQLPSHLRSSPNVRLHRSRALPDEHRLERDGLVITTVERTLLDCAPVVTARALDEMVATTLRLGLADVEQLLGFVRQFGNGRRGASSLRRALGARAGAAMRESELEDRAWSLLRRFGLPEPVPQYEVDVGGLRFRLDFAWPHRLVALECDGWEFHGSRDAFILDRRRRSALTAAGWRILVITYRDLVDRPRWIADQVRAALDA